MGCFYPHTIMSAVLSVWTVYEHPRDYPDDFVVREHRVYSDGTTHPMPEAQRYQTLSAARAPLETRGLHRMPRAEQDDPCIVETWL